MVSASSVVGMDGRFAMVVTTCEGFEKCRVVSLVRRASPKIWSPNLPLDGVRKREGNNGLIFYGQKRREYSKLNNC